MANLAQIVNAIAPIITSKTGLVLQTIFYPFELYSTTCGTVALDPFWTGDTFSGGEYTAVRTLDVSATLHEQKKYVSVYVVNRSQTDPVETTVSLGDRQFAGPVRVFVVNGSDVKAKNTFQEPHQVSTAESTLHANGNQFTYTFEPHSVTALICDL